MLYCLKRGKILRCLIVFIHCFQIKNRLFVFVNALIENPSFDSQAKEYLTTLPKNFGSRCILPKWFVEQIFVETNILELVLNDIDKRELV